MNKNDRYKCTVNNSLYGGVWEVTQLSTKQATISRIEYKYILDDKGIENPYETSFLRGENSFVIKFNNYSSLEKRILNKHSFKQVDDDIFLLYPFRFGIPFLFELISDKK